MTAKILIGLVLQMAAMSHSNIIPSTTTPEPPIVNEEDFDQYFAPRGLPGNNNLAPCNSWVWLEPGYSINFQSPKYPSQYGTRDRCHWVFVTSGTDSKINITCPVFNTQSDWFQCQTYFSDSLLIFDSASTPQRFCGKTGPNNVISKYTWSYVVFRPSFVSFINELLGFSCIVSTVQPTTTTSTTTTTPTTTTTTTTTPTTTSTTTTTTTTPTTTSTTTTTTPTTTTTTTSTTTTPPPCKCGRKGDAPTTRIVGGVDAGIAEFPWQVAIVRKGDRSQVICGGVVINNKFVLTAAHCVQGLAVASQLEIAFAEHDTSRTDESDTVYRDVSSIIIRPDYNIVTQDNDIALIRLSSPIDLDDSASIKPICFPDPSNTYVNLTSIVTGWGLLSTTGSQPDVLQAVNVTTLSNTACQDQYGSTQTITDNMICAADSGKDSCQGDSGGPLVVRMGDHYELIGLVSFGVLCANPLFPGVYVRFGNYVDWVNDNVGDATTCEE